MIPLIFAAAVALAEPIQQPPGVTARVLTFRAAPMGPLGLFGKPTVDANGKLVSCNRSVTQTLGPNGSALKKLTELPPGVEEHAVLRMVDGCPVREVVYAGQVYYLDAPNGSLERDLRGSRILRH